MPPAGCLIAPAWCGAAPASRVASRGLFAQIRCHHGTAAGQRHRRSERHSPAPGLASSPAFPRQVQNPCPEPRRPGFFRPVTRPEPHRPGHHARLLSLGGRLGLGACQTRALHAKETHAPQEYPFPIRQGWRPGQEPGIDPSKPDGGRPESAALHTECDITVVDFSEDDIVVNDFVNSTLPNFLNQPREEWVKCRWINVNGLSWDVIREIGSHKNFHRLAIEDLMNTRNRTKADW